MPAMLSGNKLCLLFLIEANSSTAAGGTGIEIANNCFPKKNQRRWHTFCSAYSKRELIFWNNAESSMQAYQEEAFL